MVISSSAFSDAKNRFEFIDKETSAANAVIDFSDQSEFVVPDRLFGNFSENLGANVYHGFWAQIFENPSLEKNSDCRRDPNYYSHTKAAFKRMTGEKLPDDFEAKNMPYYWFKWNGENECYKILNDAYNTSSSLLISADNIKKDKKDSYYSGIGIRQIIYLPIHRTKNYNLSFYVKNVSAPLSIIICNAKNKNDVFVKKEISIENNQEWEKINCELKLKINKKMSAQPLLFCIGLASAGKMQLDQINLFPDDSIEGFDPEVIALLKAEGIKILRFPGGNYVSGYHWKDDLTSLDKRPTKPNPAWVEVDPHYVGTDEHIRLCRLIGAEPMICVNAGNGTPQEAADWVEYCNGSASTKWGSVRASRGYPEPYNVNVWELGNELWGDWQIGNCTPEEYAKRYRAFYNAVIKADPSIHCLAVGDPAKIRPGWNKALLDDCSDILKSITLHFLCTNNILSPPESPLLSQLGYSHLFEDVFRKFHKMGLEKGIDLKVALTEEMIFNSRAYHPHPCNLSEALFYAGTVNSAIRTEGIVEIFNHSALLNHGGNMSKQKGIVFVNPVYYAIQSMQKLAGCRPLKFRIECPFADIPEWQGEWAGDEIKRFPLVDFMPLKKDNILSIVVINRSPYNSIPLEIKLSGLNYEKKFEIYELSGKSFLDLNDLKNPNRVEPKISSGKLSSPDTIKLNTKSCALYILTLKQK